MHASTASRRTFPRQMFVLVIATIALVVLQPLPAAADHLHNGYVYVMTNQAEGNSVIQFRHDWRGQLQRVRTVSTRGLGSGGSNDPLTSQNSLVLSNDGRLLLAVNAGSDEVSVLDVSKRGLSFLSKASSGGDFPTSVAKYGDLVYVTNAKGTPNISGFHLDEDGQLISIPNSTRDLPGGSTSDPSDIRFSPDGSSLIVTETGANQIVIYELNDDGTPGDPVTQPSAGAGPFGFTFGRHGVFLVTEALSASLSSYKISDENTLEVVSGAVPNGQAATCWIVLSKSGRYAFVTNTANGTISSYAIGRSGRITLLRAVAASTGKGSAPIDSALSGNGRFLHVEDSANGRVLTFFVFGARLFRIGTVSGLPPSIQGIAAR